MRAELPQAASDQTVTSKCVTVSGQGRRETPGERKYTVVIVSFGSVWYLISEVLPCQTFFRPELRRRNSACT